MTVYMYKLVYNVGWYVWCNEWSTFIVLTFQQLLFNMQMITRLVDVIVCMRNGVLNVHVVSLSLSLSLLSLK